MNRHLVNGAACAAAFWSPHLRGQWVCLQNPNPQGQKRLVCLISQNWRMHPVHSNTETHCQICMRVHTHAVGTHTHTGDFHSMSCQSSAMLEENVHGTRPTACDEAPGDLGAANSYLLSFVPFASFLPWLPDLSLEEGVWDSVRQLDNRLDLFCSP